MTGMPETEVDSVLEVVTFRRRGVAEIAEAMRVPSYGKADVRFVRDGFEILLEEEPERPAFEGNRRARRKAAAQARKGVVVRPPVVTYPDVESLLAEVHTASIDAREHVERAREQQLAEMLTNRRYSWEWMRVQALEGRIIDMLTPEERAARMAAFDEECRRIEALEQAAEETAEKPAPCRDRDLPAVGSFA